MSALKELDDQLANISRVLRDTPADVLTKEPVNRFRIGIIRWYERIEEETEKQFRPGRFPPLTSELLELLDECAEAAGILAAVVDRRAPEPRQLGELDRYYADLQAISRGALNIRKKIEMVRRAVGDIMAEESRRNPSSEKIRRSQIDTHLGDAG